ncbi:MAG TPA: DJ-1/PfpI family protein [Bryobacteraceae bacterium]|nr:DJ-1/PfpI family protein [Bryobacteraceae bacterium]
MTKLAFTRRDVLKAGAAFGGLAAVPMAGAAAESNAEPLHAPEDGGIPVAFLVSPGAVVIDFGGPWEVFQDAVVTRLTQDKAAFRLYTVAKSLDPITASAGLKIVPNYSFENAPQPKVIVIPAQSGAKEEALEWLRKASTNADVTMSVCTGAFVLAQTGLLAGKSATTHHGSYGRFAMQFHDIQLKRGVRFVEEGKLASAGGLSSGIDLALRVVERYYGRDAALATADYMEYQGKGWLDPSVNAAYAVKRPGLSCPVCTMPVDAKVSPSSAYNGKTYYFCSKNCKETFDQNPAGYLA